MRLFSFCRKGRRPHLLVGLSLVATIGIAGALDELPTAPDAVILEAVEFFDDADWEIRLVTSSGDMALTDNERDDRFVRLGGEVAVWQQLADDGWDVAVWHAAGGADVIPGDGVDDTEPDTDGSLIVWQRLEGDRWRIMLSHAAAPSRYTQISDGDVNSMHPKVSGGVVVWQAWIDDNWEVMTWTEADGLARMTTNESPDLSPDVGAAYVVWEGVDPRQGDRDIFAVDLDTSDLIIMTDNESTDSVAEVDEDGLVSWYREATDDGTALTWTNAEQEFLWQAQQEAAEELPPEEPTPSADGEAVEPEPGAEAEPTTEEPAPDATEPAAEEPEPVTETPETIEPEPTSEPTPEPTTETAPEPTEPESIQESTPEPTSTSEQDSGSDDAL